jgi:hypothetical protein
MAAAARKKQKINDTKDKIRNEKLPSRIEQEP